MRHAFVDPYCYPGTSVLRNHLNITERDELDNAELLLVGLSSNKLFANLPGTPHDLKNLLAIHQALFGKLYPFAGKLREHTGRLTKTRASGYAVVYCDSAFVPSRLRWSFAGLPQRMSSRASNRRPSSNVPHISMANWTRSIPFAKATVAASGFSFQAWRELRVFASIGASWPPARICMTSSMPPATEPSCMAIPGI